MSKKYVYVIYDPLYERPVCVHDKPNFYCKLCDPIRKKRKNSYFLEEYKKLIQIKTL